MPAGSDGTITKYDDESTYTIPDGYVAFHVYNKGSSPGYFGEVEVVENTALNVPYIGTTYGAIQVDSSNSAKLIVAAFK